MMKRSFLYTFTFFLLFLFTAHFSWQEQVKRIDQKIENLKEMKLGYEARALRHENTGQRLQFNDREFLEAKRHFQLAEENRKIASEIQFEIDLLQVEKEEILKKHAR